MASIEQVTQKCKALDLPVEPCIAFLKRVLKAKKKDLRCTPLVNEFFEIYKNAFNYKIQRDKSIDIINNAMVIFEKKSINNTQLHPNYLKAVIKSQIEKDINDNGAINQWGKTI